MLRVFSIFHTMLLQNISFNSRQHSRCIVVDCCWITVTLLEFPCYVTCMVWQCIFCQKSCLLSLILLNWWYKLSTKRMVSILCYTRTPQCVGVLWKWNVVLCVCEHYEWVYWLVSRNVFVTHNPIFWSMVKPHYSELLSCSTETFSKANSKKNVCCRMKWNKTH